MSTDMAVSTICVTATPHADKELEHERESDAYLQGRGAYWAGAYAKIIKNLAKAATDGGKSGVTCTFDLAPRKRRSDEIVTFGESFIKEIITLLEPDFVTEVTYTEDVTNLLAPKRALVITARLIS